MSILVAELERVVFLIIVTSDTNNILEAYYLNELVENDLCFELESKNFYREDFFTEFDNEVLEEVFNNSELNTDNYSISEFNDLIQKKEFYKNSLTEKDKKLIKKYSYLLSFDFEDEKGRKFNNLSHGEKSIFGQFINIYDKLKNFRSEYTYSFN